ncbi:MAG: cation:proton antiporter [Cyanobacteria bacterium]|nr:cation:proton antiporter [Cyanobacteria bacterium CG_2015-16_32_12]NCO79308.1 cation:proton antiporter [Cyanobacteria bacterium CG_2015-22_32_23]NCQ05044.1 cation:proton antiporter [Cyanobacteria bacterium CG_2015-09_32_10]NCQ41332.1 cation:proton antiporter [Cyanobacteria bacterium CG_2015-04_32_10]NCS84045.1 cation:proton antiporter [Cyanobacteria bacterium CG_2015-02_32_10]
MILSLILRLTIWFLLTSDLSIPNIIIGLFIAILLPRSNTEKESIKEWLKVFGRLLIAIPQAYYEALEIMIFPHPYESFTVERVKQNRSKNLIFLDIFLITFTPKTLVLKYYQEGLFQIHRILRRRSQ